MLKATLRSAVLLGLLAAWSVPSYAEVQNVKVSGDETIRWFHRVNLDLSAKNGTLDDKEYFWQSTTGLNVAADLTENVSTFVRLANERTWDTAATANFADTYNFGVSQAYVTLKELFYAPLTVRIGMQPIVWGRGFIIGSGLLGNIILGGGSRNAAITANEYTDFTAFDAVRATLDLSNVGGLNIPLTADFVYIKQAENTVGLDDDRNIQGVNLGTKFDRWKSEVETYVVESVDQSPTFANKDGSHVTWGARGSVQPVDGAYLYGELAAQWGTTITDSEGVLASGDRYGAWAFDLGGDYSMNNVSMKPKLGGEWRFYSGRNVNGAAAGWQPVSPGYFTTALREFQTRNTVAGFYANKQTGVTSGQTNQHELALYGSLKPLEDLTASTRLSFFILDVGAIQPTSSGVEPDVNNRSGTRNHFLGTEWDTQLVYNYTDDVQFGLLYAIFTPGDVFRNSNFGGRDDAQELVSTVSVKF